MGAFDYFTNALGITHDHTRTDGAAPAAPAPAPANAPAPAAQEHAYYDTQGRADIGQVGADGDGVAGNASGGANPQPMRYEHQAAGLGRYANAPISENRYRAERAQMGADATTGVRAGDAGMVHRDWF